MIEMNLLQKPNKRKNIVNFCQNDCIIFCGWIAEKIGTVVVFSQKKSYIVKKFWFMIFFKKTKKPGNEHTVLKKFPCSTTMSKRPLWIWEKNPTKAWETKPPKSSQKSFQCLFDFTFFCGKKRWPKSLKDQGKKCACVTCVCAHNCNFPLFL